MGQFVPLNLRKYLLPQNYQKYSHEDQALWRLIMKGIKKNLSLYGYQGALEGLRQTGLNYDRIPKISHIDKKLQKFGWRAVCISGFIPPRAFMEFQKNKILPIASEIRRVPHLFYTPAPDIVHEAVGHVPFLTNPTFSKFLEKYADTVLKALVSQEDIKVYSAIRDLSDLKENPKATQLQIQKKEKELKALIQNMSYTSEASFLSRFIWWTSEYGLMGSLKNPKIYGAGLISSIGESLHVQKVKKIKLDEGCLNYPFDITQFQPQLFVAKSFEHLLEVLENVSEKLAFRKGGLYGIQQALKSKTLNTLVLDSGLQISGVLEKTLSDSSGNVAFVKFSGPVQLSFQNKQLKGHGKNYHKEGYSSPLGLITKQTKPFHFWNLKDLQREGLTTGTNTELFFQGGLCLKGELHKVLKKGQALLLLTFKNCRITDSKGTLLYHPSWGPFDLAPGSKITSVFSGLADPKAYQFKDVFEPSKIFQKKPTQKQKIRFQIYKDVFDGKVDSESKWKTLFKKLNGEKEAWLIILELLMFLKNKPDLKKQILRDAEPLASRRLIQNKKVFAFGKKLYDFNEIYR